MKHMIVLTCSGKTGSWAAGGRVDTAGEVA